MCGHQFRPHKDVILRHSKAGCMPFTAHPKLGSCECSDDHHPIHHPVDHPVDHPVHHTTPSELPTSTRGRPHAIPQHNLTIFCARINRVAKCPRKRPEHLNASLLAERLKPLSPNPSGQDRPGLLVTVCSPHRGSARAKQVLNACSVMLLAVHGVRNLCGNLLL